MKATSVIRLPVKVQHTLIFIVFLSAVLICCGFVMPGDPILQRVALQLDKWSANEPIEKVYLQLDKPYYSADDDIWFKAYVVLGDQNKLSSLSGVLNVELIDQTGEVQKRVKLPIISGLAWGDFSLSDTIRAGNYRIRAYTNYMRNAGEAYFFNHTFAVGNLINSQVAKSSGIPSVKNKQKAKINRDTVRNINPGKTLSDRIDVQFFPESGNLINFIGSKVAFKAMNSNGLGVEIKGSILDNKNAIVSTFSTQRLGMGVFNLEPKPGVTYTARIICPDGSLKTMSLPPSTSNGSVMMVDHTDPEWVTVRVGLGEEMLLNHSNDTLSLIAQERGKLVYAAKTKAGSKFFSTRISKSKFSSGVVQFTLFSQSGEPLNERLIFVQNPDQINLRVEADKQNYAPQEKIKLRLNAQLHDSAPLIGSFSIAVTDETKVPQDEQSANSILACLLLTSDLRGYIEKPNYYFTNISEKTAADLDVLMMTQGYRRFEWRQLLQADFPPLKYQPEKTLSISGRVTSLKGKPIAHGKVVVQSLRKQIFTLDTTTDEGGRFAFRNMVFSDSLILKIQARTSADKSDVNIELDTSESDLRPANKLFTKEPAGIDSNASVYFKSSRDLYEQKLKNGLAKRTIVLKEVITKSRTSKLTHSSNLNGAGNADQVLTGDELSHYFPSIADDLQGRLTGVDVRKGRFFSTRGGHMNVMLDGNSIPDDVVSSINAEDIESVEVLRSLSSYVIYGSKAGKGGLILLTSKTGDERYRDLLQQHVPGLISYSPTGYYIARTFYSPKYGDPNTNAAIADLRSTVFWDPNVITDKNGLAELEFFNAGGKGTYRVTIEGLDSDGHIGRKVFRYQVK